jgi:Cu(I)/Ag(I) efflux system membrane fusion protein
MRHEIASLSHRLAATALAALALAACGGSRSEPVAVRAGDLEIRAAVAPEDPRVGANRLWVELRDAQGRPVEGAELEVAVRMHAMGAMPAMGGPARVEEEGGGRYRADFSLGMGGTWHLELLARPASGAPAAAEGSVTVGTPGLRLEPMGGGSTPADAHAGHEAAGAPAGDAGGAHPAEFRIAPERLQRIGVRTTAVERRTLASSIRAAGRVTWDETALVDVSLRVAGWVGELHAASLGDAVTQGEVLFTLYSPELFAAQQEYLQALRSQARARDTGAPERADALVRAARNRLRLWDVAPADLDALARRGEPLEHLPVRAPASGFVVEKEVVAGSAVEAGQRLFRIAPLDRVWIEAELYETELAQVEIGTPAEVTLAYLPGRRIEGRVAWVLPALTADTRTGRVRVELANPELALRPGMWASVGLSTGSAERLAVPLSAVLHAGDRSFVFLELGDGRFRPQQVEVGRRDGESVEILAGVEEGQRVVASGTFLVASESRLRAALDQW